MLIEDGKGSGQKAEVNSNNQLVTRSIAISAIHDASLNGDAYSWTSVTADIDTGDTALCVVNRSQTRKLVISKFYGYADVPSLLKIHVPAAATWAGTAVVGVNLSRVYSAKLADAVAYADETGTTFAAGNTVVTLATNELTTDQHGVQYDFNDSIVLGYDDAIAMDIIGESAAFECTFVGYYID